jgi:hypothetical protein
MNTLVFRPPVWEMEIRPKGQDCPEPQFGHEHLDFEDHDLQTVSLGIGNLASSGSFIPLVPCFDDLL